MKTHQLIPRYIKFNFTQKGFLFFNVATVVWGVTYLVQYFLAIPGAYPLCRVSEFSFPDANLVYVLSEIITFMVVFRHEYNVPAKISLVICFVLVCILW